MKKYVSMFALGFLALVQSCATTNNANNADEKTFWVAGYKTEASNGAGKSMVYLVNNNENFNQGDWQNFYAPINGFDFEEGTMKQITVTQTKRANVPADASSLVYTYKKTNSEMPDLRTQLNGNWMATTINGQPINRMVTIPTLQFDVAKKMISGNDGCNDFSGKITMLNQNQVSWGMLAKTQKACFKKDVSGEYNKAIAEVAAYEINKGELHLRDAKGNTILTFLKK